MRKNAVAIAISSVLLTACSVQGLPGLRNDNAAQPAPSVTFEQSDEPPSPSERADIVERVLPSVVNVRVRAIQSGEFGAQELEGQGSGVIVDAEQGIVITNNHVVQCAVEVTVAFTDDDREPVEGRVLGTAPEKDLAVVQIEADDLEEMEIGRSSSLRLGDEVIALGFPLGLGGETVTSGILSGEDRRVEPQGSAFPLEDLLQTDAAINPGNSGGPLVDGNGRLVGINTAAAGAATAENIGFAIPIDGALPVIEEIVAGGERAWLGVSLRPILSAATAVEFGVDTDVRGAGVIALLQGPAEGAGIAVGDVIVEIEGEEIDSSDGVSEAITKFDPGDTVTVTLIRGSEVVVVEVRLAPRPPQETLSRETC